MKKHFFAFVLISISSLAFGTATQTEAPIEEPTKLLPPPPDCKIPAITSTYGAIIPGIQSIGLLTKFEVGKPHQDGAVIYYTEFKSAEKYYYSQEDIRVKNTSPFNPTMVIKGGRPQGITGIFISKEDGRDYDIISGTYATVLVNPDGFICQDGYETKDGARAPLWTWSTSAHSAMTGKIEQSPQQKSKNETKAIAIQLLKYDELQTTFQISKIINDNIIESRKIIVNSIKGSASFFDMQLKFHTQDKMFYLDEFIEPKNFNLTLHKAFGR